MDPALSPLRARTARLALPLLAWRLALPLFVVFCWEMLPPIFSRVSWLENFRRAGEQEVTLASAFSTWDAQHYLHLAADGYRAGEASAAYYPLWPALLGVAGRLSGGHYLASALVLSLLLSWIGTLLFHAWSAERFGPEVADRATLLLLASPGALFFAFPYSESLFLFLVALFLLALERRNRPLAALAGFLLPLARPVGIFAALAGVVDSLRRGDRRGAALLGIAPIAGWGSYLAAMKLATGNAFAGFEAQKLFVTTPSLGRLFDPGWWFRVLTIRLQPHGFFDSAIDRVFFVAFLLALAWLARRREWTLLALAAPMGIVPAITVAFMSFTRYFVVILPVFVAGAVVLSGERRDPWRWVVTGILMLLQLFLLVRHANFIWAG